MLLYKVASFVVIDFENGVDYISFSVFDFSALKNGTEYSFVNDQFQVNDYTDVTLIKDKSGTTYTEATLDAFIATIKVISDPSGGGLPIGGTTGQILAKIDGTDYNAEWIDNLLDEVNPICKLDENISKGQAVYISGADGTNKVIKKASNTTELTSSKTFGLLSETGVTNNKIRVITLGYLSGLDTSSANEGDPVWLGVNGNLIYGYVNKPHAPEHLVFIGFVVRKNNVNGQIYVRVQNGFELNEIHDVKIESPANKNTLFYNSSNSLWENRLIGITDVTDLESALSGKVDGSGTINFVSKFTASGTIGNSLLYDDGTSAGIGTTTLQSKFHIYNNIAPSLNAVTGYNAIRLDYDGGENEEDKGAGIVFAQKWYALSSIKVATGAIFGVKSYGSGNFGGGLAMYYTPIGSSTMVEGIRLYGNGNVGINIPSPLYQLHVNGRIQGNQLGTYGKLYDYNDVAGSSGQFLTSIGYGVQWSDIKNVNGNSLLGTGNIVIPTNATHIINSVESGQQYSLAINANAKSNSTLAANQVFVNRFIPSKTFTINYVQLQVTATAIAGALARIVIFTANPSDINVPLTKILETTSFDCSTVGNKTFTISGGLLLTAGTAYYIGVYGNNSSMGLTILQSTSLAPIYQSNGSLVTRLASNTTTFGTLGSTWPGTAVAASTTLMYDIRLQI